MTLPIQIAPSVLPADFAELGKAVRDLESAGVDLIQWDVMDGQFVPNLTFGPDVIAAARKHCSVPFEAHLMVLTPDVMAEQYVKAGCSRLIVHAEACTHLHRTLANIRNLGATAGVALNPATPASAIENILDLVDMVLVMTVNPGFGGQSYIAILKLTAAFLPPPLRAQRAPEQMCSLRAAHCSSIQVGYKQRSAKFAQTQLLHFAQHKLLFDASSVDESPHEHKCDQPEKHKPSW